MRQSAKTLQGIVCLIAATLMGCSSIQLIQQSNRKHFENPGGMWMPHQLAQQSDTLDSLGVENPQQLSDPLAYPLGAIVWLGGCSASFVSPEGLIVTNHHCASSSLQFHSTPESNLYDDGFLARSCGDELPGETGKKVWVTQAMIDVTETVRHGLDNIADPMQRYKEVEMRIKNIIAQHESEEDGIRCEVKNYFMGSQYYLIKFLELRDVRLVYAPPGGVGWFGGLVDNWHWPRQTGDFTFYRAYIGPDGKPAEYSEDNVPYQPKHYLRLATEPLEAHDFVMVAGYPGQTQRWQTAGQIEYMIRVENPKRIRILSEVG
ncbi:MAG: S46 family peptidase, partial [Planctomycetota bacterium]